MNKSKFQMRIIGSAIGFCILLGLVVLYGFPWLSGLQTSKLSAILEQKKTVVELRQEQANIEQAKKDLTELKSKAHLPEGFFSKDITLVDDIRLLETRANDSGVDLTLTVSGTLSTAVKAKNASELFVVPFSVQLKGPFGNVAAYMDFLEHFGTLFTVRNVSLIGAGADNITANLVGNFYLRK